MASITSHSRLNLVNLTARTGDFPVPENTNIVHVVWHVLNNKWTTLQNINTILCINNVNGNTCWSVSVKADTDRYQTLMLTDSLCLSIKVSYHSSCLHVHIQLVH